MRSTAPSCPRVEQLVQRARHGNEIVRDDFVLLRLAVAMSACCLSLGPGPRHVQTGDQCQLAVSREEASSASFLKASAPTSSPTDSTNTVIAPATKK